MPFVTLREMKPLVPTGVMAVLSKPGETEGETVFDEIERQAAAIISERTGTPIPDDVADRPSWAVIPSAWIIKKLCNPAISGQSAEYMAEVEADYNRALAFLNQFRMTPVAKRLGAVGIYPQKGIKGW